MLCVLLAGAMTDLYGQDRPPASRLAPPGGRKAETTPDTSPPILSAWSGPPVPQCCLANKSPARKSSERLQAALESALADRLHGLGSTIYQIAWKPHVTPLGRQISRQRASARRISDSAPSSGLSAWPTPTTRDWKDGGNPNVNVELNGLLGRVVWLAGWPTPMAGTPAQNGNNAAGNNDSSRKTVELAGWPTPVARDSFPAHTPEYIAAKKAQGHGMANLNDLAQLTGWTTASASDGERGGTGITPGMTGSSLTQMAQLAGPARFTASGQMLTGCSAGMESGGQLNPRFSGWLMGYPDAWCRAALSCPQPTRSRKAAKTPAA